MRRRFALFVLVPLLALSALFAPHTLAQGTLDQSNTVPPGANVVISQGTPSVLAQSFTAGLTGKLDSANLSLHSVGGPATATVSIYATTGALPNAVPAGAALATTTITVTPITPPTSVAQYTTATFGAPASVVAGQIYALVLGPALSPPGGAVFWELATTNPYAAGNLSIAAGGIAGPYGAFPALDADFQTFVTLPAAAVPQVLITGTLNVPLGVIVKGCGSVTPSTFSSVNPLQSLPVTAVACAGSVFTGWTGGPCSGTTTNPCDIAPNGVTLITANFTP